MDKDSSEPLVRELGLSPLASQILCRRGIRNVEEAQRYLSPSLKQMRDPALFRHMDRAVERLLQAILRKERVLIYGDYDVDGLTSTAVLLHFLKHTGLNPLYHVPDRLQEGYGFHPEAVRTLSRQKLNLIVTVDCGITAFESVRLASHLGIDVIITDHHECQGEIPPAAAVLNPKVREERFPFRELAGVGVAFYLVVALRRRLREIGFWGRVPEPNLRSYLDLVALGTLADMVPLREENRIFVKAGLEVISSEKRPGLSILKAGAGLRGPIRDTRAIVYRIVPRINAPGRLGCPREALEALLCEDSEEAVRIARALEGRNLERRALEDAVYREAKALASEQVRRQDPTVLVLSSQGWHTGILGIVASRLARDFQRTVVLVSLVGTLGKGSVRSTDEVEFLESLLDCKEHLEKVGGHPMAAGITLKADILSAFSKAFEEALVVRLGRTGMGGPRLMLDGWIESGDQLNELVMRELDRMAPFGHGNPEPVLGMARARLLSRRVVGEEHVKITLGKGDRVFEAIGFGMVRTGLLQETAPFWDVVFSPKLEYWDGNPRLGLHLLDLRPCSREAHVV